ncbi:MAG: tetratricopeptide repeat protein [Syntrophomonas sp.]
MITKAKPTAWNYFRCCTCMLLALILMAVGTLPAGAEESSPNDYFNSGKTYYAQGNYEQGLEMFEQAITGDPDNDKYYEYKGDCLVKLGRIAEALDMFEARITVKPEYAGYYIWKGYVRFLLADFANATTVFDQAAALSSGNRENLNYIYLLGGICEVKLGQNEQALQSFAESIKNGEDKYNLFWKANTLIAMENYQEAYAAYSRATEILAGQASESATTALAYNNMAYCQIQLGDYTGALKWVEQGLTLDASAAVLYKNQGLALQGLGRYEEANAAYQKSLSLKPEYSKALQALEELGQLLLPEATDLAFVLTDYDVDQGETTSTRVNAWYTPGNGGNAFQINVSSNVQYQSENPAIAGIDNKGVITGIAAGETRVTASYSGPNGTLSAAAF